MEMAMDVVHYIQSKFYETFPAHPREAEYNFTNCSTLKPTQIETGAGSINQIPGVCVVRGDVRLSPFYDIADVRIFIEQCVRDINANPAIVDSNSHGPHSKYVLESENVSGRVELKWLTGGENGIACSLESVGHKALVEATLAVKGTVAPYSVSGSLPLVRDLQEKGYDIQLCGYGLAKNREYSTTVTECIQGYFTTDLLERENQYSCPRCRQKRDAVRETALVSAPPVLMVQLRRY
eukprot:gene1580-1835_t